MRHGKKKKKVLATHVNKGTIVRTGPAQTITVVRLKSTILELEDVLFNHDSAVMMPDNPQNLSNQSSAGATGGGTGAAGGTSAGGGTTNNTVSGLRALSLVYRELRKNPDKKVLLAGHADHSGAIQDSYDLAAQRAQNVFFLLAGERNKWAENSAKWNQPNDLKLILQYLVPKWGGRVNPGSTSDLWDTDLEKALSEFIFCYDRSVDSNHIAPSLKSEAISTIVGKIKTSCTTSPKPTAPTPEELPFWKAVFDIYQSDLTQATMKKSTADTEMAVHRIEFTNAVIEPKRDQPFISCGQSFPRSPKSPQNNRPQQRRVELLFFDKGKTPEFTCPKDSSNSSKFDTSRHHTAGECPLWNTLGHVFDYIDPDTFSTATYHLKFVFYNRVAQSVKPVPAGIVIQAWKEGDRKLKATANYDAGSGVYEVTVLGLTHSPREPKIHFTFETAGSWIFSKDATSDSKIVSTLFDVDNTTLRPRDPITPADVEALPLAERAKYYQLPKHWDSRNWLCSIGGRSAVSADQLLKMTSASDPIVFNLDAIVLVSSTGDQKISDTKYDSALNTEATIPLDADSRIALLYLDDNDSNKLKIHHERTDARHYSQIPFQMNFIDDTPAAVSRIVYFNNAFYDVTTKRTEPSVAEITDPNKKFVCGARAAVLEDAAVHVKKPVCVDLTTGAPPNDYAQKRCGNYELHYFDQCGIFENQPLAYLLIYWNCRLIIDTTEPASDSAISDWMRHGMAISMFFSNRPYIITPDPETGSCDRLIRPFHYYEAKQNDHNGKHKCMVSVTTNKKDWMLPETARFCYESYNFRSGALGPDDVVDVDGGMYEPLMSAHEMGHATGHFDDYLYDLKDSGYTYSGIPSYDQLYTAPGGPYNLDTAARMRFNRKPRMRDFWHFVNWLNDDAAAGKPLHPFLKGSAFYMTYKFTVYTTGADRTITIDLRDSKYRNTSAPAFKDENFAFSRHGNVALYLYKLGGGETAETIIPPHVLDGILVINIKIAVKFLEMPLNAVRSDWIQKKLYEPLTALNRRFYAFCESPNPFKKTLISVTPYFSIYSDPMPPADTHFRVIVRESHNPLAAAITARGTEIQVKRTVPEMKIVRHMFGLPTNSTDALTKDNFDKIALWICKPEVANGTFSVKAF
jgi:hypothetical protein